MFKGKKQSIRLQEFALQRCMFSSKMGCDSVGPLNDMCIGEDHSIRGVNAESRALAFDFSLWGRSVWPDAKEEGEDVRIPFCIFLMDLSQFIQPCKEEKSKENQQPKWQKMKD